MWLPRGRGGSPADAFLVPTQVPNTLVKLKITECHSGEFPVSLEDTWKCLVITFKGY